jgi:uncharacterized membrane protein YhfC
MVLLSIAIVVALLVTMVLPVAAGFWLKKRLGVGWRVIMYGAMAYFVVQAVVTLIFSGFIALVENGTLSMSNQAFLVVQLILSIFLTALLGVLVRWIGMKYIKEELNTLEAAYGLGLGYGGIESLLMVGFPLLTTFITMLGNLDYAESTLAPEMIAQLEQLWSVQAYIPLSGTVERISTLVMHITVTILILQVFKRKKPIWLAAAFGDELLVAAVTVSITETGIGYGWLSLLSAVLAAGNIYLLYRLHAFEVDFTREGGKSSTETEGRTDQSDKDD